MLSSIEDVLINANYVGNTFNTFEWRRPNQSCALGEKSDSMTENRCTGTQSTIYKGSDYRRDNAPVCLHVGGSGMVTYGGKTRVVLPLFARHFVCVVSSWHSEEVGPKNCSVRWQNDERLASVTFFSANGFIRMLTIQKKRSSVFMITFRWIFS